MRKLKKLGDRVEVRDDARGLYGPDSRAGHFGVVTGVHETDFFVGYNVRFDSDDVIETISIEKIQRPGDRDSARLMDDSYPMYGYVYDEDGDHSGKQEIFNVAELSEFLRDSDTARAQVDEKREIRITDCWDLLIWHAVGGAVVHDGTGMGEQANG